MTDKHNFTSLDQPAFDEQQTEVDNSVRLLDCFIQNKEPFRKKCQAIGGVGLRQNAIDILAIDTHITNNDIVNDLTKRAVNQGSMVDRRQSTVECTDYRVQPLSFNCPVRSNLPIPLPTVTTGIPVHHKKNKVEGAKDYEKLVEEVTSSNSNGVAAATQITNVLPLNNLVDSNKLQSLTDNFNANVTAEDNKLSNNLTGVIDGYVNCKKPQGKTGYVVDGYVVNCEKDAVEENILDVNNTVAINTKELTGVKLCHHVNEKQSEMPRYLVDCEKMTVEDNTSVDENSIGACNRRQLTAISSSKHHINKQNTLGIAAYMVDCEKKTVEDDASYMNRNGNVNATEIAGIQFPNHDHITKNKLLGIAGSAVDRKKETVEDDTLDMNSSAEIKTVSTEISGTQFPNHHVTKNKSPGVTGFVVDREKKTVEDDTALDVNTDAAVKTCTKSLRHVNLAEHTAELENKMKEGCNLVNQRTTAHSSPLEHRGKALPACINSPFFAVILYYQ